MSVDLNKKVFFDLFRMQMGGRLTQKQVDFANDLLAKMPVDQVKSELAKVYGFGMVLSQAGLELIAQFEGFRSRPYRDSAGIPTIGYGNTYYLDGRRVKMTDDPISQADAKRLKIKIVNRDFAPHINRILASEITSGQITQNMFDAMVSLAYNIGVVAFARSSVVRFLKNGDKQKAADAFLAWNKAGGKILGGLVRRREKERELFLKK